MGMASLFIQVIDAHCHFTAMDCLQEADLRVQKYIEIVKRLQAFQKDKTQLLLCMGSKRLASKKSILQKPI
jgi:hypothetical protein